MPRRKKGSRIVGSDPVDAESNGRQMLDASFSAAYEELKRLASAIKHKDPRAMMSASTLAHQAWIKLAETPGFAPQSELHFKRIAAEAMRHIVIDAARRRQAFMRGGQGVAIFVTLDDSIDVTVMSNEGLERLHDALDLLALNSPRQAEMVVLRFFGGYDVAEASAMLDISEATAMKDWRVARAWLAAEVRHRTTAPSASRASL